MIPPRFHYLENVAKFIYLRTVKGNELLLTTSVILGVGARILLLLGFAMTLQAIVATIRPEIIAGFVNKLLEKTGLGINLEEGYVVQILMGVILLIYGSNWVLQYFRSLLVKRLNKKIVEDSRNFKTGRNLDDDIFIIGQTPGIVQSVEKCIQIAVFMLLIMSLIALMVPNLALLLLPVLIFLVVIQIYGGRKNLKELVQQQSARKLYINHTDPADGIIRKRTAPENSSERSAYLAIMEQRRHRLALKPESEGIVGVFAITLVIYYLYLTKPDIEQFAGLLIVFVVGIRSVIASGRELSNNVSRILELRKYTDVLRDMLATEANDPGASQK